MVENMVRRKKKRGGAVLFIMANERTTFFVIAESRFYTKTFKICLIDVSGCNDKHLPAGCPRRGTEGRGKTYKGICPVY